MPVSVEDIARQMLALLPEDGTAVPNRVMRVMLARALSADIDEGRYRTACERLAAQSRIGLAQGQGGGVVRKPQSAAGPLRRAEGNGGWSEASLMPWLRQYLDGPAARDLPALRGAKWLTCDTSSVGTSGVQWARPDFTLISVKQFKLLPGIEFDVHSFELKTESGGATDLAVFEALAQTRYTNFGYLVWHLPHGSRYERKLSSLQKQCGHYGIGFIRLREPQQAESFEILVEPLRKTPPRDEIDQFLDARLRDAERRQIRALLNGAAS
ncbi:hypothetical protein [Pseudorhodoplanes sp.]|uniref:hypothetical protein n=1 Tax=Pseudorhodoplanes sp. TaxID=1934341 RepID=UPI0039193F21